MSKFKVGDKVKVKGLTSMSDPAKKEYVDKEYVIESLSLWANWPYVLSGDGANFNWRDEELELVESKQFTKSDLKDGMVVENRDGERGIYLNGRLYHMDGFNDIDSNWDDELKFCERRFHRQDKHLDIVRVYAVRPCAYGGVEALLSDTDNLELIWERKEEPEHKEMTVEEIEKELGYKIKVVGDSSCRK